MRKSLIALAIVAASFAGAAQASDNVFIGAAATQSHIGTSSLQESDSTGVKVFGGYNISPRFGIESGYSYTEGFRAEGYKVKVQDLSVALTASVPIASHLSAFAKTGLVYQDFDIAGAISYKGANPLIGVGLKYSVTKDWALRAEAEYTSKIADISVSQSRLSIGAQRGF